MGKRIRKGFLKSLVIYYLFILMTALVFASQGGSEKFTANIVCTNPAQNSQFLIDPKSGKAWYRALNEASSAEIQSAMFSGIVSTEKFVGEILGEFDYRGTPSYSTLIIRSNNGKPELEAQIFAKATQETATKFKLECEIK